MQWMIYIPIMINKIIPSVDLNYWLKSMDTASLNQPTVKSTYEHLLNTFTIKHINYSLLLAINKSEIEM